MALAVGVMVGGCVSSVDTVEPVERVAIAPKLFLELPLPAELGRSVDVVQRITARYGQQAYLFEARLAIDPDQVRLVGTDPMGRRALTLTWTRHTLDVQRASFLPEMVRPENVLADLILMFWPEAAVRRGLAEAGATVTVHGATRSVMQGGDEVVVIRYEEGHDGGGMTGGAAHLTNRAWHYDIDVRSATVGP